MAPFQVDIEQEKVLCDGEWIGKMELVERIRRMIETGDYRIGMAGNALEYLQKVLSEVHEIRVKFLPEDLNRIEQGALQAGMTVGELLRQAAQAYLAAHSPHDSIMVSALGKSVETVTNEPLMPGTDEEPVPLTQPKNSPISIPRVDAALPTPLGSTPPTATWNNADENETVFQVHPVSHNNPIIEDAWFKKG